MTPSAPIARQFLSEVQALLGPSGLRTLPEDTRPYATDWRGRYSGNPLAVVFPRSTLEVAGVVKAADQCGVAIIPQGGNTGLTGATVPDDSGAQVILNLSRMNRIRARDAENKTLTVEAGVTMQAAQEAADAMGLLFPLSLPSRGTATIGGNLATNAGGTAVLRYGNARALCLGLEVVTAQGDVWHGLRGLRKDNTGYDLRDLFIGSEGTLGVITAAVLALMPKPAGIATALARVPSMQAALSLLARAQDRADAQLTGFEMMTPAAVGLALAYYPALGKGVEGLTRNLTMGVSGEEAGPATRVDANASDSHPLILLEVSSPESEQAGRELLEGLLSQAIEEGLVADALVAQSLSQSRSFWDMREHITLAASEDGPHIKHDISLPISAIPVFVQETDAFLQAQWPGVRLINFGHLGDGNLHYNVAPPVAAWLGNPKVFISGAQRPAEPTASLTLSTDRTARHKAYKAFLDQHEEAIRTAVHDRVMALGGSISAEHGLGLLRRDEAAFYKSPVEMNLMRAIKRALDPKGIMNPGKVLSAMAGG
ncbi:MAG: FAD-binding oxidoreductase [Betaproteobacteria bacterium]|nr:FAD-binding oxidoreductase [Betaproteobacteria bacterium]